MTHVDRQIKGQGLGDPWDTLEALVARLAGESLGSTARPVADVFLQRPGAVL